MKTNILSINTIKKSLSIVMMLCVFGIGHLGATTIASWGKVQIPTSNGPTASGGDANNSGTARIICNYALTSDGGTYCYYGSSASARVITISNLNLSGYKNIKISFYSRASQKGTLTATYTANGSNWYGINGNTVTLTTSVAQYTIEGIPSDAVSIKLTHDKAKSGATFYFGTIVISGDKISTGECTAGIANGIAPGDVVVIYNSTAPKEMKSFSTTNHCVDAVSCSSTPAGVYPLTIEAGSTTGSIAFKTPENKYLRMTSGANNALELSNTKDAASSWSVTITGGVASIVNKSFTTYGLRYNNSTNDRFSSYGTGSMAAVSFYRYCVSAFHVTYDANTTDPSVANMPTDNTDYADGANVSIPNTTPTRTGYTFYRWYTNEECTTPAAGYAVNTSNAFQIDGADVTLYAKWTPNPYRVDVASPNHVAIGVSSPVTIAEGGHDDVNCGATVTLSMGDPDAGYSVVWDVYKTGESSTKVSVTGSGNGATFVMPAYAVTVTATITPPWIYFTSCSNKKRVYYNANTSDASVDNMPTDNNEYDENDYVSIPNTTPTRTGYTFYRWYTNEECTTPAAGYAVNTTNAFQITANTTLYAKWNVNEYRIDVASPDRVTIKATPSGGSDITEGNHADAEFGQTVTLNYTSLEDGYGLTWDVYKTGDASTKVSLSSTTANNATFTMPAYPVTVTATTAVRPSTTVTFYLGTSNTASGTLSIGSNTIKFYNDEAGITALPTVSSISCGDWDAVVGWTENSSYSESTTPPTMITASVGTPYKPATDKTVYAVYKKVDGSDDFDGTNSGTYYIRATPYSTSYYASECMGSDVLLTSGEICGYTSDEDKVAFTFTKVSKDDADYYNITCDGTNYIKSYSSSLSTTTTYNDDAALWSVSEYAPSGAAGTGAWRFANKSTGRNFVFTTNSRNRFVDWAAGNFANSGYPLELLSANTNYYSVNPECTSITITKGTCTPASSVLDASSHACDFKLNNTNYSSVTTSSGGSVTIYLYPNDDYTDVGATVSVDVPGNVTTINSINTETHTCLISGITGDITVSVSYVARPKYTVTLYDNGALRTTLTEEHYNAGVTLPSGTNCTPTSPFTFEGWTESAVELNADPVRPAAATLHAAGSYSPTSNITLYSVYSRSVDGCEDFAAGKSGAYTVYRASYYAQATGTDIRFDIATTSTNAAVFYISYFAGKNGYTIRTKDGYVGWNHDGSNITKTATTPYYWNITGSAGTGWKFTPQGISGEYLSLSTTGYFKMYATDNGYNTLTKTAMTYYYNTALCGDAKITFHDGGGTISGTPTTPTGASWNSSTHVLSGLEDCDKITTFPTASYDGWTFIGWSTEDYSNSGKHTADYAEENASTDEPDGSEIYKTDGNPYVVRGGSIDLYPIFTRFPDNEPFNTTSGGDYYIYYLAPGTDDGYGANKRIYAADYDGEKRYSYTTNCSAATLFTFAKLGNGKWTIYDNSTEKYLVDKNDDWLLQQASTSGAEWTVTLYSGNQFDAYCNYENYHIIAYDWGEGAKRAIFQNYNKTGLSNSPTEYHRVYLGSCTERIFSSDPNPTPTIDLTGEPYVTATNGQEIRATATMTVSAAHLTSVPADKVIVSGTNLRFATAANTTPTNTLSLSLTSGNLAATTIYVYYNPSATEDGIENIVVTAKAYNNTSPKDLQTTGTVHARHLPADFVIAAKWGDLWYALPNTCTSDGSSTTGVVITVDNDNDPTAATAAPSTAKWGLRKTKAGSRTDGSHNDRMVFTERATATANNQQALYNYNSADVYASATYENYNNTNPTRYEWIPVSSDFKDYTLTNTSESKPLILRNDGDFKAQTTNQAYGGKVRLLPATFYTEAPMQVIEWKASSVVVMYTGSGVTATTKVGSAVEGSAQTLTAKKIDHGVFELTTGSLTSAANKQLIITIKNGSSAVVCRKAFVIPAIINTSGKTADYVVSGADDAEKIANAARTDVVILDGGVLSAVATKYTYKNITVYPGGKLVIGSEKQMGMNSLTLRGGSSWGAATYEHKYPQFVVNNTASGAYTNSSAVINYDYVTTKDQYYSFVLPYDGSTAAIKYPVDIYGSAVSASNTGSFEFQYYDGAARATGATGWKVLAEPATLVAGRGYTFLGMPKKVDAYDGTDDSHSTTRQTYGIHRIPMSVAAAAVQSGENNVDPGKSVPISVTLADKNNASGWVLVGNPYLSNVGNLDNSDIQVGQLVHTSTVPWDGKWEWDDTNPETGVRYVVIPNNSGTDYSSEMASDVTLPAFKNFFVQISNGSATSLVIPAGKRKEKALIRALLAESPEKDIRLAVDLVSAVRSDKVDLLINDNYSAEFDQDGDFTKMMNGSSLNIYGVYPDDKLSFIAVDKTTAAGSIAIGYQVPEGGDYTLQLSDREYVMADAVEALYVTDHEMSPEVTTNLLDGAYEFHVNNAETNDTRFTVSIKLKENQDTPTDIDIINGGGDLDGENPIKFIYQDKMYILRNGVLYDATGKRVKEINK